MNASAIGPELARAANVLVKDFLAVEEGESVVITTDTAGDRMVADAVLNAAVLAGAKPGIFVIPQLPFQGGLADPYISDSLVAVVSACDVWIDLAYPYVAGSHAHDEAMKTQRVRYFLGGEVPTGSMIRLFGRADLDKFFAVFERFTALLAPGTPCHITNEAGTDVTFSLAEPPFAKRRQANSPGNYTIPGVVALWPDPESVRGQVVIEAAFHEYYTLLPEPITVEVDGRIKAISGGGNERRFMDRALKRAGGGEYGHIIHFTNGIHPVARWTGTCFVEDMRATGNNACGFGVPFWLPGGGENHPDGVIKMQSLWVDGEQVVADGTIVSPPDLAKLSDELQPLYL